MCQVKFAKNSKKSVFFVNFSVLTGTPRFWQVFGNLVRICFYGYLYLPGKKKENYAF